MLYARAGDCHGPEVTGACNDDLAYGRGSSIGFSVVAGTTYFLVVDGYMSSAWTYTLTITPPAEPPGTCAPPPDPELGRRLHRPDHGTGDIPSR